MGLLLRGVKFRTSNALAAGRQKKCQKQQENNVYNKHGG